MANKKTGNDYLLDRIFRDPEIKHGLKIFASHELQKLKLAETVGNVDEEVVKRYIREQRR